jgi:DNA-binding transcriptional LysR family regulator
VESTTGLQAGRVEIAAMPSQTVEPLSNIIQRFTTLHPGLSVAIRAAPTASVVLEMVRSGVTELGLLGTPEPAKAAGVRLEPAGVQRFILVAPPGSPFADGAAVRREELRGQRLIVGQPGTGMRRLVDEIQADGVEVTVVVESEHREAFLPLVLGGVGYAVLAESWATLARQAGATVSYLEPAAYLHLSLASRNPPLTPAAEAFLAVARDHL